MNCSYEMIQTPKVVWEKILEICPVELDEIFLEPFRGEGSLYNQINSPKYWCEITESKNVFDFDFSNCNVTTIYTNPPFKCNIPNKGISNCVYFFLEYFMKMCPTLVKVGFLMNAKSFQSITPKRLCHLNSLGFHISKVVCLNIKKWYGLYYFVLFEKKHNDYFIGICEYF